MQPGSEHTRPADHTRFARGSDRTVAPRSGSPSSLISFPSGTRPQPRAGNASGGASSVSLEAWNARDALMIPGSATAQARGVAGRPRAVQPTGWGPSS
jgi:hypothetical protein